MKIKVPGCSVCKKPYDWSKEGLDYDLEKLRILPPLCENDKEHIKTGYVDILVEIEVQG